MITAGKFDGLADLTAVKSKLLADLARNGTTADPGQLADLRRAADRNARLLAAAQRGMRAAQSQLARLRDPAPASTTYDGDGKRQPLIPGSGRVERSA